MNAIASWRPARSSKGFALRYWKACVELENSKEMKTMPKVKPIPEGMHTVTPHLVCAGAADAIDFYKKAFNAVETLRLPGPNGKLMHAEIRIGDSTIMLAEESPEWGALGPKSLKGSPVTLHLSVENIDAFVERAVAAGAKITMPVADTFWGDRYGQLEDPFGHRWSVATNVREMSLEEIKLAAEKAFAEGCPNAQP
ncbi:MAG: VOC family protein [Desulfosarcina sp.]